MKQRKLKNHELQALAFIKKRGVYHKAYRSQEGVLFTLSTLRSLLNRGYLRQGNVLPGDWYAGYHRFHITPLAISALRAALERSQGESK